MKLTIKRKRPLLEQLEWVRFKFTLQEDSHGAEDFDATRGFKEFIKKAIQGLVEGRKIDAFCTSGVLRRYVRETECLPYSVAGIYAGSYATWTLVEEREVTVTFFLNKMDVTDDEITIWFDYEFSEWDE